MYNVDTVRAIMQEARRSPDDQFLPNPSLTGTFPPTLMVLFILALATIGTVENIRDRDDPAKVRLETATTSLSSGELIQNLIHGYDEVGNPTRITSELPTPRPNDSRLPGPGEWTYTYDGVDRLTFASGSMRITSKGERFTQSFAYTPIHNLRQKTREHIVDQPSGTPSRPPQTQVNDLYTYGGPRPHAPTRVGDLDLVYDASGNVIERRKVGTGSVERLTWADDNRLVEVQQSGTHLRNVYDHEGKRVVKRGRFGETIYASAYFDLESGTHCAKHVFAGPVRVATIMNRFPSSGGGGNTKKDSGAAEDAEPPPPTRAGSAYYYHPDHLGGTTVLTAPDGDIHEHLQYFPDGALWIERGPRRPIDGIRFSGKGFDAETGFYDFGQRFYDPRVSLWLSPDPAVNDYVRGGVNGGVYFPPNLGLYTYTYNSPARFVDPDGLTPVPLTAAHFEQLLASQGALPPAGIRRNAAVGRVFQDVVLRSLGLTPNADRFPAPERGSRPTVVPDAVLDGQFIGNRRMPFVSRGTGFVVVPDFVEVKSRRGPITPRTSGGQIMGHISALGALRRQNPRGARPALFLVTSAGVSIDPKVEFEAARRGVAVFHAETSIDDETGRSESGSSGR